MPSKKKAAPKAVKKPVFKQVYVNMRMSVEDGTADMATMLDIFNMSGFSDIKVEQLNIDISV